MDVVERLYNKRLLAKRWRCQAKARGRFSELSLGRLERHESLFLPGHLRDAYEAGNHVLKATGQTQLAALGLEPAAWLERLRRVVLLATALHDLGKCNDHFQDMLRGGTPQTLRHEWVGLLILETPGWRDWLLPALGGDEVDWSIVLWCIAGHHPRYDRSAPPEVGTGRRRINVLLDHDDVLKAIEWLRKTFELGQAPILLPRNIDLRTGVDNQIEDLYQLHYAAEDQYDGFPEDLRRFVAVAKASVLAADVAGSALPRTLVIDTERSAWIGSVLNASTLPGASDFRRIIATRLKCGLAEVDSKLRPFQRNAAAAAGRVTIVRASCGTGKTLLAYRWGEVRCPGRRLYICYPTTGTATEGFRDYLLDPVLAEYVKTNLEHGRRQVDFRLLQADEDRNTSIARIESLDLWRVPVVACTVDTVLGLVQNNRRGLCAWPALAQGAFVFDEIHSYDDKLFDALLHFLDAMRGVPVLLMTASLPDHRRNAIEQVLLRHHESLIETERPTELEQQLRYHASTSPKPDQLTAEELACGGKILRVCNTVAACMRVAESLKAMGLEPIVYHSRFKYLHRVEQHRRVIDAFEGNGSALAVCSQVAEMSLDLSATLLVTDLAPVPALIQRLGRLNRKAKPDDRTRPFLVTDPLGPDGKFSPLPYDADDLETAKRWLEKVSNGPQSQLDLAQAWERLQDPDAQVPRYQSAWLDFGPATPVLELREGSPSLTVVLHEDWAGLRAESKTLPEVAIPMPNPPGKRGDRPFDWQAGEFNGVPVVRDDALKYDPERGAEWNV